MKQKDLILLILLLGLGFLAGGVYLQSANIYKEAYNTIAKIGLPAALEEYTGVSASAALAKTGVALYPGAQRITFAPSEQVNYRAAVSASQVAAFYAQDLSAKGWEELENTGTQLTYLKGEDEVTISLEENPLSNKTKITYAFAPTSAVLGIKLAQESPPPPPPGDSGSYTPPPSGDSGSYTPPPGGTYTPPPGDGGSYPASDGTTCPAPPSCQGGSWVIYDSRGCPSGCSVPPSSGTTGSTSCSGGQVSCTMNGGSWCQMPPCPSSTNNYPSSYTSCPSDQYMCNGTCVPMNSPCNGNMPSSGGSCTGGQVWCASSSGGGGWCQMPPCPSQNQYQQNQPYQQQPNQPYQQNQQNQPNQQNQQETCRVNGVEMPGSCSQYNQPGQMMGPKDQGFRQNEQNGQMGPEGQQMGPGGPSEEEMKKMDDRRFQDMKRGLSQFSKGTTMMKKSVEKMRKTLAKCGVGIPVELDNALKATDGLVKKIQDAKTADELEDIIGDVEDVGMTMQEWGPRMGDLGRLCQMMRQGDRDMKRLERDVKRVESRVKANKKLNLTEILNTFKEEVAAIKGAFLGVVTLAKTDPGSALEKLEDEFYGGMDDIRNSQMAIETAINVTQGLRNAASEIKKMESQIKSLQKKKVDTGEAEDLLATMKSQIAELQQLVKGKFDAEELIAMVEDAYATRQDLQEIMQELQGTNTYLPSIKADTRSNVNFELPDAFRRQEINSGGEEFGAGPMEPGAAGGGGIPGSGF